MTALSKPNVKLARARAVAQQGFRDVEGKQLPFSARGVRLGEAGVAVPLLFETTWGMMIVMLIAFATNFAFGVVGDNWRARPRSPAWNMRCTLGPWEFFYPPLNNGTFFATGGAEDGMARARDQSELDNAACASLVVSVVLVLFMYWLDFQEQRVAKRVDKAFLTASDFAVEVRDLPLNACDAKEVSSFFGQFGEIAYVELAFASSEFSKLKQQWEKLAPEHAELKADGKQTAKLAAIAADLAALEEKMSSLKRAPRERGLGIAFVVFNEERARRKAIVAHKASVSRFLLRVLTCGCCGKVPKFRGKFMLTVLPAPEPMDVFWENLHVPRRRLRVRATIGVLGAVAVAMPLAFLLASAENRTEEISDAVVAKAHELHSEAGALAAKSEEEVIKQVVTQLKGLALKPITGVLTWSSTRLTQLEHRWTRTDYEQSLYFKAAIGILLNEALGAMIAGWNQPITADDWEGVLPSPNPPYPTFGWFESTDSVMASQYATIAASLLVVAYELLQPNMLVNRYVRARFAKSQARLDALWSPQQAGMGDYYLTLTTVVALGVIYGPAMPVVYLISALLLFLLYFANKYTLLRVYSNPPVLNDGLSTIFQRYLALATFTSLCVQLLLYGGLYELGLTSLPAPLPAGAVPFATNATHGEIAASSRSWPPDGAGSVTTTAVERITIGYPLLGMLMLIVYAILPTGFLPCCRAYVDNSSKDASHATYISFKGKLAKYTCPINLPMPSLRDAEMGAWARDNLEARQLEQSGSAGAADQQAAVPQQPADAVELSAACCGCAPRPRKMQML